MQFTVITPTHDRLPFLREAVASVQASILTPLDASVQYCLLDNGAKAETAAYLQGLPGHDERIKVLQQPEQVSAAAARNLLIEAAPGGWIVPLDDDDILLQRSLYHYGDLIQQQHEAQWLVADFLRVDQEGRYLPGEDYYAWRFETPADMLRAIFRAEHFIQGNVCYRRALVQEVGGYDEGMEMAEDLDLYVRFLLAGHLPVVSPHISHLHRFHSANVSIGVNAARHNGDLATIYGKYADRLMALGVDAPG